MKVRSEPIVVTIALIAFVAVVVSFYIPPKTVPDIVERAFGYRPKDEPEIVSRKWEVPLGPQGVYYWEDATIILSPSDFRQLIDRISADGPFAKTEFNGHTTFNRELHKARVSWSIHEEIRELSYFYSER